MSELILEPIELAKTMQWNLDLIEDPIEANYRSNESANTLNRIHSDILSSGKYLVARSLGGYVFRHWSEESQTHISIQYEQIVATGRCTGQFGFLQNIQPRMQTLFVALTDARVLESLPGQAYSHDELTADLLTDKLVLPVLDIEALEAA